MATKKPTPPRMNKTLTSSASKSVGSTSRVRARRSITESRVAALKEDDKSTKRRRSITDLTPRTLIQGILQNTTVEPQPPPPKRPRPSTPEVTRPRPRTPGTLPHSTARRRVTRLETLATPGPDPTPRSLIQGLVGTAPVETPAIHLRRSSAVNQADFPDVEEAVQGRENRGQGVTLSPFIRNQNETQSQPSQSNLRKRQPINMEDFAAGVRERLSQKKQDGETGTLAEEVNEVHYSARDVEETSTPVVLEEEADLEPSTDEDTSQEDDLGGVDDTSGAHDEADGDKDFRNKETHPDTATNTAVSPTVAPSRSPSHSPSHTPPKGSTSSTRGSTSSTRGPTSSTRGPTSSTRGPTSSTRGPTSSTRGPTSSTRGPTSSTRGPTSSTRGPTSSTRGPTSSTRGSTSKQAADSTWTGRDLGALFPSQRGGSPSEMRRVPDSTVGDSGSEGDVPPAVSHHALDSELSLGGYGETQQTVAGSQSSLSGFSPLVTPRLPLGAGRPTPALRKTPAPNHQATHREQSPTVVHRPPPPQKRRSPRAPRKDTLLPTSLTKGILAHFSKARVSKEAVAAVEKGAETFFKRLSNDLVVYSNHAHRHTIEQSDVELLMRRQGLIQDQQSLYALIEKYLPMEYRQELIPMATAGNKVAPKSSH